MLLYLIIPFLSPSLSVKLQMRVLHEYPAAVCNDGSPAAYYTTPHDTVDKMFIFLAGGDFCASKAECRTRCINVPWFCTGQTGKETTDELVRKFWFK